MNSAVKRQTNTEQLELVDAIVQCFPDAGKIKYKTLENQVGFKKKQGRQMNVILTTNKTQKNKPPNKHTTVMFILF